MSSLPKQVSPEEAWATLSQPWRTALEAAWQSYRDGGIAVGAVLTDGAGTVVGTGRNQRFGTVSRSGLLAHAEMEALSALPAGKDRPRDAVLYTTLHPCPMCLGATVVARVSQVHFGAVDPTWCGIERLPQLNDEVRRRWPTLAGPQAGPLGAWCAVLPCLNTSGALVRVMRATAPRQAALALAVARRFDDAPTLPGTAQAALAYVWDLLRSSSSEARRHVHGS